MSETKHTPAPWFVSGVRIKMDRQVFHGIARYDEAKKQDETIACVGYDTITGLGMADAHLIAAAPELLDELTRIVFIYGMNNAEPEELRTSLGNVIESAAAVIAKAEGGAA
jgi:hypothetical protein